MRLGAFAGSLSVVMLVAAAARAEECRVAQFDGITHEEAESIGATVCGMGHGRDVRAEKVGARYVVTWQLDGQPKQVSVISLDELPAAITPTIAPPVVTPHPVPRHVHFMGSLILPAAPKLGVNWGIGIGILAGNEQWQFLGEFRLAGSPIQFLPTLGEPLEPIEGTPGHGLFFTSLSAGVRRAFPSDGVAPFVGVGIANESIGQYHLAEPGNAQAANDQSGVAGLVEAGVTFDLNKRVAGELGARVDLPTFAIDHDGTPVHVPVITAAFTLKL